MNGSTRKVRGQAPQVWPTKREMTDLRVSIGYTFQFCSSVRDNSRRYNYEVSAAVLLGEKTKRRASCAIRFMVWLLRDSD